MYHERQHLMHCAMHALNNLFQEQWADRALMERIALDLCNREATLRAESGMRRMLTNPFKSVIPLVGDYDINVVIEALKLRECRVSLHVVFNPRDPSAFELALAREDWESTAVVGIIVNFVCRNLLWGAWVTHHFYAIVKGPPDKRLDGADEDGAPGLPAEEEGGGGRGSSAPEEGEGGGGSVEDGRRSAGSGSEGGRDSDGKEGRRSSCLERLSPESRRAKRRAQSRDGGGGGDGDERGGGEAAAVTTTGTVWYSLDSRLSKPQRLGGTRGLLAHLSWEVREHHGHVFVVGDGVEAAAAEEGEQRGQTESEA